MDTPHEKKLLTIAEIYVRHGFLVYLIDQWAAVAAGTTDNMLQGIPVAKMDAEAVLAVLSAKLKQDYNLSNVTVKLKGETNGGNIIPTNTS